LLGTREAKSAGEKGEAVFMAVGGIDVGQRPSFWQPYSESRANALAKSRPLEALLSHYPERSADLRAMLQETKIEVASLRFLPMIARGDWTVVIDSTGNPVAYLPANGFF
jgi:hypothetical protein